ncbi:MAG: VCBS repeat-containing protein [Anaerolineae bacterium]|nr:VCBS repeat-containing protein [Anaerolineae bacterium]
MIINERISNTVLWRAVVGLFTIGISVAFVVILLLTGQQFSAEAAREVNSAETNVSMTAQTQPTVVSGTATIAYDNVAKLGERKTNVSAVAIGDLDGDGDLDIVTGGGIVGVTESDSLGGQNYIFLNDGGRQGGLTGTFEERIPFGSEAYQEFFGDACEDAIDCAIFQDITLGLALADMDDDGDLDIITANMGSPSRLYLNDGFGRFPRSTILNDTISNTVSIAIGDIDGDGDFDIVTGNSAQMEAVVTGADSDTIDGRNVIYLNDGTGQIAETIRFGAQDDDTRAVVVAPLDGDDALDIAVANYEDSNIVYLSDAIDKTGGVTSFTWLEEAFGNVNGQTTALLAANIVPVLDVDNEDDEMLDLIAAEQNGENAVYINFDGSFNLISETFGSAETETFSLATGDLTGDGELEILAGNARGFGVSSPDEIFRYQEDAEKFTAAVKFSSGIGSTTALALGDLDDNGTLDVVAGRIGLLSGAQSEIFFTSPALRRYSPLPMNLNDISIYDGLALGDLDQDGDLDIAAGDSAEIALVWNNFDTVVDDIDAFSTTMTLTSLTSNDFFERAIALSDMDGDNDIDIVAAASTGLEIFTNGGCNSGTVGTFSQAWQQTDNNIDDMAVGDVDGDQKLDLVVIRNNDQELTSRVYVMRNQTTCTGGTATFSFVDIAGPYGNDVGAVKLADIDADGDLDIVAGVVGFGDDGFNFVRLNNGEGRFDETRPFGRVNSLTEDIAVADFNGDGLLDIAEANLDEQDAVYINDGRTGFAEIRPIGSTGSASIVVSAGDADGDGDTDLVTSGVGANFVYINDGSGEFGQSYQISKDNYDAVFGDLDNDGINDIVTLGTENFVAINPGRMGWFANNMPDIVAYRPNTDRADLTSMAPILSSQFISVPYTLWDPEDDHIDRVVASYSLDGGDNWQPAVAANGTAMTDLLPGNHTFVWDVYGSNVFGRSDHVVLRLQAFPSNRPTTDGVPVTTQWPYAPAVTFPFRLQGRQVRVTNADGSVPTGALLYRLNDVGGARADVWPNQLNPMRADSRGVIPGRGVLNSATDQLVALWPVPTTTVGITFTDNYSLFYSSAAPSEEGIAFASLDSGPETVLTVTAQNPLLLFNVDVSLEWDARNDRTFMLELQDAFVRASELLFDVTNGQVALGDVTIYHDREKWDSADVVILANNSLRPSAVIGGIVEQGKSVDEVVLSAGGTATRTITGAYQNGQILMGPIWDPFGESTADIGDAWWRSLAHEFAHYLLFLPDSYLGFENDLITSINCLDSFMTNTYDPAYSEFLTEAQWQGDCANSLASATTGRADWQTIISERFYPMLYDRGGRAFKGPGTLPLNVTQVRVAENNTEATTLPAKTFDVRNQLGNLQRVPTAQVYLIQTHGTEDVTDDTVMLLGNPLGGGDRVRVRGAAVGDRVCLFDANRINAYNGCLDNLSAFDAALRVRETGAYALEDGGYVRVNGWQPEIIFAPVATDTIRLTITQDTQGQPLHVQVYPAYLPSNVATVAPTATLNSTSTVFSAEITLPTPSENLFVRLKSGQNESITQFYSRALWGPNDRVIAGPNDRVIAGPNDRVIAGPNDRVIAGPNDRVIAGANDRLTGGVTAEGQATVYNTDGIFENTGIRSLQVVDTIPSDAGRVPLWMTPVGQLYRLALDADQTISATRMISFRYLQRDVPKGYEHALSIYHLAEGTQAWKQLSTTRDATSNVVIAELEPTDGYYAVMAVVELPPLQQGWNLLTYPIAGSRPVTEALAALSGKYAHVLTLRNDATTGELLLPPEPSALATATDWQTPKELSFGRIVWIYITEDGTIPYFAIPSTP